MVIRYALIALLLIIGICAGTEAQESFADRLYDKGEFGWAYLEYERQMFAHPDTDALPFWKYRGGKCLMQTGRHDQAVGVFSELLLAGRFSDSASLQAALCELTLERPDAAARYLLQCRLDYAKIVRGYMDFLSSHYASAIDTLETVGDNSPHAFKARALKKVVADAAGIKKKHYAPALALSIIPGLGHLYCGRRGDAAMTAITVATGAMITGYYAYHKSRFRAMAAGTVSGLFYAGGMYGAVMSVKIHNRKTISEQRDIAKRIVFDK
jgi:tetratricopeptide (TPR) repeat protein